VQKLTEGEVRVIIRDIFEGLVYMNSGGRSVIHRDIKPGESTFHLKKPL